MCSSRSYERGYTGSMADDGSLSDLEELEKQLQSLLGRYSSDELRADSKPFCTDFCQLVEQYTSHWHVPLPQLRILEIALCYFTQASSSFTFNCDHALHTLSSLALSVFELLLFFQQKDLNQDLLKQFIATFQECYLTLERHRNVHLLQVEHLVKDGGPWANSTLQAVLTESSLPQDEVDRYIDSELPVFFELRVRYLLACERLDEAVALAKCCAYHPRAGQHLFFLQVYLTWLYKTAQHDRLHKEVVDINGEDAVHIICSLEFEESSEFLLGLSRVFLSHQLSTGDMNHLWDLVFIWTKLHSRLNTSKQALLEESHQLMLSAASINSVFPFIRAILQELGEDGIQFCVELCANALESCLPCDVITKSLIYKTIASLLPNDLEVCRACALLVFFLERTVETYKMVYLLYMHPDQEYHAEHSPIGNHVRFETLQVLKKDLYFDPEFWNLIALRTNCLKLMNEKVVSAALEEIMEEKWVPNYCTKEPTCLSSISVCQKRAKMESPEAAKKRHHKDDGADLAPKRLKVSQGKTHQTVEQTEKRKGFQGSRPESLRRSFWQLGKIRDSLSWQYGNGEQRRTTRLSEKTRPKRKIRRPKWLLEDSGNLEENDAHSKVRRGEMKSYCSQKPLRSCATKKSESVQLNNNAKHKTSYLKSKENDEEQNDSSVDCFNPVSPSEVVLELSLPDNEVVGTFTDDVCSRQAGCPQILLYKPTVKLSPASQPVKVVHRNEVILRARDPTMFVHQLHCYARRQKGVGSNIQVSVSTITRSSVQGSPPKTEVKGMTPQKLAPTKKAEIQHSDMVPQTAESISERVALYEKAHQAESAVEFSQFIASSKDLFEIPDVEVKVSIASQSSLLEGSGTQSETSKGNIIHMGVSQVSSMYHVSQDNIHSDGKSPNGDIEQQQLDSLVPLSSKVMNVLEKTVSTPCDITTAREVLSEESKGHVSSKNEVKSHSGSTVSLADVQQEKVSGEDTVSQCDASATDAPGGSDGIDDISALTLVTEMVTEIVPGILGEELNNHKELAAKDIVSENIETVIQRKVKLPHRKLTTSSCSLSEHGEGAGVIRSQVDEKTNDISVDTPESSSSMESTQESEESKLEYCCIFCKKSFKGRRVVAHAMFHYRKDECMFCGTMFKDDLLAMMHLSDHIEKLKKSKDSVGNKIQENPVLQTKHKVSESKTSAPKISIAKTSVNVNTNQSSFHCGRGRPRKIISPTSQSIPVQSPHKSRELRSNKKLVGRQFLEQKRQKMLKRFTRKSQLHKLNGHIGKNKTKPETVTQTSDVHRKVSHKQRKSVGVVNPIMLNGADIQRNSSTPVQEKNRLSFSTKKKWQDTLCLRDLKGATKQTGKAEENNTETRETLCCPMDGCTWYTLQSRSRVSFLYHALEDHYGDARTLELAFSVANNKCGICMRVLWSFQHFQHHVERHRLFPRHPCLHQGCTARFKTGNEMRRHARKHCPLQAVCCLPGCPKLFICLWALNLHEKEHYASKRTKTVNKSHFQNGDRFQSTQSVKKHDLKTNNAAAITTVDKTLGVKTALRSQTMNDSKGNPFDALPLSTLKKPKLKQQLKARSEREDSCVIKNQSNKGTSARQTPRILRLRLKLRKRGEMRTNLTVSQTQKFFTMTLLKPRRKLRHTLQKKQVPVNTDGPRKRGRPRGSTKLKKAMLDGNATKSINESIDERKTRNSQDQLPTSSPQMGKTLKLKVERSQWVKEVIKTAASVKTVTEKSPCKSVSKQIKKSHIQQRKPTRVAPSDKTQTLNADRKQALHMKQRITRSRADTNRVNKSSASKRPAKSDSEGQQVETKAVVVASCDTEKLKEKNGPGSSKKAPPTTSKETQKNFTRVKLKSHVMKKCPDKIKDVQGVSSNSDEPNEKHKDVHKKIVEEKGSRQIRTAENDADPGIAQQETSESTSKSSCETVSAPTVSTLSDVMPPAACVEKVQKVATVKSKHSQVGKKLSKEKIPQTTPKSRNTNKKHKEFDKTSNTKSVKKNCPTSEKPVKSKTEVHQVTEAKAAANNSVVEDRKAVQEAPVVTVNSSGSSVTASSTKGDANLAPSCKDKLSEYRKTPYRRVPPTAYLDEKYISMPKRRKEMTMFPESSRGCATALPQRHRCANCFACFNSTTELQSHLQLQSCSSLFGFDSDDDANS
ncbi:uncharacterized protein LOC117514596 isoform X2 [Thalassophryne amazonica]|uniref:uncharacterized protein LOC117514596 isoform X2 n=1 Tax=Thalassophryne amazonica TaxID=390379 RepID=UPI0014721688|nr:uncharacterized protein LOC117514596 isoform X2 [Thalassophryne amazonica]